MSYATIADMIAMWRPLSAEETEKAEALLPVVSDCIDYEATKVGKNIPDMIAHNPELENVVKSVVVDVVKRYMTDNSEGPAFSQMAESAGGYSVSGTFLVPGGGLFIKKSELARLGLRRQKLTTIGMAWND